MAIALTVLIVIGILPLDFAQTRVKAASPDVYESSFQYYSIDDKYNFGRVFVPKADGKYPVIIFVHGSKGQNSVDNNPFRSRIETWVRKGYADPAIFVMPTIQQLKEKEWGTTDFGEFVSMGYCLDLVDYLKKPAEKTEEAWKNKIDVNRIDTITGVSMGGSVALFAGMKHPGIFKNVGALSPSQLFYKNKKDVQAQDFAYWVTDPTKLVYTDAEDAHLMLAYGKGEDYAFSGPDPDGAANRYYAAISANENNKNQFLMYKAPAKDPEGNDLPHGYNVFYREFFCYLYYLKFGRMLDGNNAEDAALIEAAMGFGELPELNVLTGTVTLTSKPIYSWAMSAVADCNCSKNNLAYQWQRDGVDISGETYQNHVVGAADIGHRLRCVVTDKTGTYTGSIVSAETDVVVKADGPAPPTGLTTTPCTKGLKNGKIKNVTAKMEYSANAQFNPATACTGTEITGLAAGDYFIRVAETETVKPGGMTCITVKETDKQALQLEVKHNVEFDNNVAMHYLIPKSELSGYTGVKLVIDKEIYEENAATPHVKQFTLQDPESYKIGSVEYWHFTFPGIAASEMGNRLMAKVTCEKGGETYESEVDTYSVKDYAYARLDKSTSASYKKALVDMLNYGAAAQTHFKKNAANPVNANLTAEQKKLGTPLDNFSATSCEKLIPLDGATATFDKKNVVFDSNVLLAYRMTFASGQNMENVKVTFRYDNGKGEKTKTIPAHAFSADGNNAYVAYFDGLTPAETGCAVSATIYDGSTKISGTLQYSIESYVSNRMEESGSTTYKDLLMKMVLYGRSVKAHFQ